MKLFELDLYKLHDKPDNLHGHEKADDIVPERIMQIAKRHGKLNDTQEKIIAKNTDNAYEYATFILRKPWPKGEDAISKDPEYSYWYACNILKQPFPKGEDVISKNSELSYMYARDVMKGKFPKGEDAIAKNASTVLFYAKLIKNRFIKGEKTLTLKDNAYYKEQYEKQFGVTL